MRFLSTRLHGVLDYLYGAALIVAPWLLGFAHGGAAQWVMVVMGVATIGVSLITDYELGVWRMLSLPSHLVLDVVGGLALLSSPFMLGFSEEVLWPHLGFGLIAMVAGGFTMAAPSYAPKEALRV